METQSLSPLDQLQAIAAEEGKPLQALLDEAIYLLRRIRVKTLDRETRRDPKTVQRDFGTTPSAWARQDIEEDAGLMEDLLSVYRDPVEWQALLLTLQKRAAGENP
ncbi:hypothetical protein L1047_15745 [Synechococcus sp. Nb3U1]|uniref:hypothetical protein n=1 Tax=Synechococcus sp. Nb3U1 TaxID=1914529 RepID=UPI001F2F3A54|nr:hypothetical protein [Synechococcus sp. Nb3U1]MCF2972649.1 hypothetical protein [Synechococcus sp. Nb3U1]